MSINPIDVNKDADRIQQGGTDALASANAEETHKLSKRELLKKALNSKVEAAKTQQQQETKVARQHATNAERTQKEESAPPNKFTQVQTPAQSTAQHAGEAQKLERVMPPAAELHKVATDPQAKPQVPGPKVGTPIPNGQQSFQLAVRLMGELRDPVTQQRLTPEQVAKSIVRQSVPRTQGGYLTPERPLATTAGKSTAAPTTQPNTKGMQPQQPQAARSALQNAQPRNPRSAPAGQSHVPTQPQRNALQSPQGAPIVRPQGPATTGTNNPPATVTQFTNPVLANATHVLNYTGFATITNLNKLVYYITVLLVAIEMAFKVKKRETSHLLEEAANMAMMADINVDAISKDLERVEALCDFLNTTVQSLAVPNKNEEQESASNNEEQAMQARQQASAQYNDPNMRSKALATDIQRLPPVVILTVQLQKLWRQRKNQPPMPPVQLPAANRPNADFTLAERLQMAGHTELANAAQSMDKFFSGDFLNGFKAFGDLANSMRSGFDRIVFQEANQMATSSSQNNAAEGRNLARVQSMLSLLLSQRTELMQNQTRI